MNLPNKITVARIFVSVFVLVMLLIPWEQLGITFPVYTIDGNIIVDLKILIAGGLFVLGSFTDFLDGHIARSRNIVTDFGKVMDSIADKILVNGVLIILAKEGMIPLVVEMIGIPVAKVLVIAATILYVVSGVQYFNNSKELFINDR